MYSCIPIQDNNKKTLFIILILRYYITSIINACSPVCYMLFMVLFVSVVDFLVHSRVQTIS